jgi:long-chain acyl-CoA synthetase
VLAHPKVREAVVVGVSNGREESVKAVVVPGEGCGEREVIEFCRERLANFKVPQVVEFRDEIPRSPLGKVLRKYLV